jgi:hypothetical protein
MKLRSTESDIYMYVGARDLAAPENFLALGIRTVYHAAFQRPHVGPLPRSFFAAWGAGLLQRSFPTYRAISIRVPTMKTSVATT